MCIGAPGRVIAVDGVMAQVRSQGRTAWFNAMPVPDLKVGAWVVTQANLVVEEVGEAAAMASLAELAALERAIAADRPAEAGK